ncbi:MAG: hypothetical protein HYV09_02650 [Deltaproteobacteria bacterium]|nr:hypothetical protein [Deltaproteobacteria bacterium]
METNEARTWFQWLAAALCVCSCSPGTAESPVVRANEHDSGADGSAEPPLEDPLDEEGEPGHDACPIDRGYDPKIDPAMFVATIDNPFFPLRPGTTFRYKEGVDKTVEVTVTPEKKTILGVSCTVVHDVVRENGEVIEDTFDWYAQDASGAVWYFGEDTKEYEGGVVVSTEGSWQAGLDGAKAGLIMPANPAVGDRWRQEYYACHAEDEATLVSSDASVTVPAGTFSGCRTTRDTTRLDPAVLEEKYYCPGFGVVLAIDLATGEREALLSREP